MPATKGSYLLVIRLDQPLDASRPRPTPIPPGWYIYAGSAFGPGGLRARIRRHLRQDKTRRWHIDQLTICAAQIAAVVYTDRTECELIEDLIQNGSCTQPVGGFGSSDCTNCVSHLIAWKGN